MAAPLEQTCEGGENQSEEAVDYVELLRSKLRQKKVMYITDVILELEEITLDQLMKWTRNNLIELLDDIHNDEANNHKIKVVHRNKFADAVIDIQIKQNEALQKEIVAPSAESAADSSKVKLFFLGQEEEEAIESIQSAQQFIEQTLLKMKKSFANLEANKKNAAEHLQKICNELKQQIDEKQKRILSTMNAIYHFHLNELKQRNATAKQSANVIAKFYSDYQSYFTNDKLTKTDRKQKLLAAKTSVAAEVNKIKKHKDVAYNMEVLLDKEKVDHFLKEFLELKQSGVTAPALNPPVLVENTPALITWNEPQLNNNWSAIIKQENDDHKEDMNESIDYRVLYQTMNAQFDEKEDNEWNTIIVSGNEKRYNMKAYVPCKVAMQYTINDIFQSQISNTMEIKHEEYIAVWSGKYKRSTITLSENNTKAQRGGNDGAIRAENPIKRGMIVKLDYICGGGSKTLVIIGVISSEFLAFDDSRGPYADKTMCKYCYGADCYYSGSDTNKHYYGEYKDLGWTLGEATNKENVTVQMIVDYSTYDTCCLSFYIDGEFKGPKNAKYSMKLPKLDNDHVWFPVTSFWNGGRWCKIACVE